MPANYTNVEKRLWEAADQLRANSKLKSSEYSVPVLGLIFLRYADHKFTHAEQELAASQESSRRRRTISKLDYQARGVMYLPDAARFSKLLDLPEGADIGGAINAAMKAIEDENEELKTGNVLPKNYKSLDDEILLELLKILNSIPMDIEGVATLAEIEAQGWSLNPGRYVGVAERAAEDFDFAERLEELNEELEVLNAEARELEERIAENVMLLLEGSAV